MTKGSSHLFRATKYRAYFRNVTILVPTKWDMSNYPEKVEEAVAESFSTADIIIDVPNKAYNAAPYTSGSNACGAPKDYIHLTYDLLLNTSLPYGPLGNV